MRRLCAPIIYAAILTSGSPLSPAVAEELLSRAPFCNAHGESDFYSEVMDDAFSDVQASADFAWESYEVAKRSKSFTGYVKSPYVTDEAWAAVYPYLLPVDHPLKPKLDKIFHSGRATSSIESMEQAGFVLNRQQGLHVVVARHPSLKGVVVKAYLDSKPLPREWEKWIARVQGANAIRDAIRTYGYTSLFKAPRKWIYPLPDNVPQLGNPEFFRKHFILIAEDMKLVNIKENKKLHRSDAMTREVLEGIYIICEELGLADTPRIANLAWTKDRRLAFVDTEAYLRWPVKYHPFFEYLYRPHRPVWEEIISSARQE